MNQILFSYSNINATLITMVAKYVFPYSWEWSQAWLLGAILSATDPVAVVKNNKTTIVKLNISSNNNRLHQLQTSSKLSLLVVVQSLYKI